MIDWDDLRYYLAAAQAGTVTGAADILKVSRTTVSRRVESLERNLGLALFELTASGPGSTDVGREVLACARDVETRIREMLDKLSLADHQPNTVRISVPAELDLNLVAAHDVLCASVPSVKLEFVRSFRPEDDLRERSAFIGLCVADTLPANLKGTCLGTVSQRPYGPAGAERRQGEPSWIGWGRDMRHCTPALWMQANVAEDRIVLRVNSGREMVEAVRSNLGIGYLWERLASGTDLSPIEGAGPILSSKLWLLMHEDVPPAPHIRTVLSNLGTLLGE